MGQNCCSGHTEEGQFNTQISEGSNLLELDQQPRSHLRSDKNILQKHITSFSGKNSIANSQLMSPHNKKMQNNSRSETTSQLHIEPQVWNYAENDKDDDDGTEKDHDGSQSSSDSDFAYLNEELKQFQQQDSLNTSQQSVNSIVASPSSQKYRVLTTEERLKRLISGPKNFSKKKNRNRTGTNIRRVSTGENAQNSRATSSRKKGQKHSTLVIETDQDPYGQGDGKDQEDDGSLAGYDMASLGQQSGGNNSETNKSGSSKGALVGSAFRQ